MTTQTDNGDLIGVLASMRRFDMIVLGVLVCSQSVLGYAIYHESATATTERELNDQRHQQIMQGLKASQATMNQSVRVESARDAIVKELLNQQEDPRNK